MYSITQECMSWCILFVKSFSLPFCVSRTRSEIQKNIEESPNYIKFLRGGRVGFAVFFHGNSKFLCFSVAEIKGHRGRTTISLFTLWQMLHAQVQSHEASEARMRCRPEISVFEMRETVQASTSSTGSRENSLVCDNGRFNTANRKYSWPSSLLNLRSIIIIINRLFHSTDHWMFVKNLWQVHY